MKSAKEISALLAQRAEAVTSYLFPNGKRVSQEWCIGSLAGESGQSLKIHLEGSKAGVFCDFATGESGDLLDVWRLSRHITLSAALFEATQWLGMEATCFTGYKPLKHQKPDITKTTGLVLTNDVKNYLVHERKLTACILDKFKITANSNEIVFPYYWNGELVNIKYLNLARLSGKKQIRVEAGCRPCLFGWQCFPSDVREVTLCEGEIDAMTLTQYGFPALSVPFGGGTGAKQQWVENEFDNLAIFDKIYLCLDNDAEGEAATKELIERLGRHRCYVIKLPYKDANACLQAGVTSEEIKACFVEAKNCDPAELKSADLFLERVIEEFYPSNKDSVGIHPPWDKARGKILFRPDELSVWTGINGHGKSQLLGQIILASMQQNTKVCVASLELKPQRLLMRLTKQACGLPNPTAEYIKAVHDWYSDRLWLFDLVGNAKSERLLEVFRYARQRYGITIFVIDSFMKLDISEDDYRSQKAFLEKLCDFKNEYNCHVHLVVHPRKGVDEAKLPGKLDTKGTGAITDLADNCFVVWRNKAKEANAQKAVPHSEQNKNGLSDVPDVLLICDKQRNGEWEGKIGLWFDADSFQYLNHPKQRPLQYVAYSSLANSSIQP